MIDIKLDIDDDGKPILAIKHHERKDCLEQRLLGHFIKSVKENGIVIKNSHGMVECGTDNSWEVYIIKSK